MRKIKHIIVHHSLSHWADGKEIVRWHCSPKPKGNNWKSPGYHAVICNGYPDYPSWHKRRPIASADGRVDRILSEDIIANGVKYGNANSLHVCLVGNLDDHRCTKRQMEKLTDLLVFWCKKYGLAAGDIYGHGEMQRKIGRERHIKTCPGRFFDLTELRIAVSRRLK